MKAFIAQDTRPENLVQDIYFLKVFTDPLICKIIKEIRGGRDLDAKKIINANEKLQLSLQSPVKFSADWQGTHWKTIELEKVCEVLQSPNIIMRSRISFVSRPRYLPKICSR